MRFTLLCWALAALTFVQDIQAKDHSVPVREVTVFKDGHALVTHQGTLPTDEKGNATIDHVPTPVIGTFWAHSANKKASLRSLTSGTATITKLRSAATTLELLQANTGARVLLRDSRNVEYSATIVRAEPTEKVILLKTDVGTKVVPADSIREVTFIGDPKSEIPGKETRNQLRLTLDWGNRKPDATTEIGMSYLQRGIRWIPNYRLHLKDDGTVRVQLQATLLNEMIDLKEVTVNLLVGVPTFDFKGTIDPIALQQTVQQLSNHFSDPRSPTTNQPFASNFGNSVMLQQQMSRMGERRGGHNAGGGSDQLGPDVANAGAVEDLFVYTVEDITLAKGERMIVHVGEWEMKYEDIYRLQIAATPPNEVRRNFNSEQQKRIAMLRNAPKVKHMVRIANTSSVPLTTAPALIITDRSVLGQGMMTFTSPGGSVDVGLTTAINVPVSHKENQVSSRQITGDDGYKYLRFEYEGSIRLKNFHKDKIQIEVVRNTLGEIDSADKDGKISKPSAWTDNSSDMPAWWRWYSWPSWWYLYNARGRAEWDLEVDAEDSVMLTYKWHYQWRL